MDSQCQLVQERDLHTEEKEFLSGGLAYQMLLIFAQGYFQYLPHPAVSLTEWVNDLNAAEPDKSSAASVRDQEVVGYNATLVKVDEPVINDARP